MNNCEHEPVDLGMEYFMVVYTKDDLDPDEVVEISLCSKCHLLYWGWRGVDKDGGQ